MSTTELEELKQELNTIGDNARAEFGKLTAAQLNWKSAPDRWSVGQCFDHLVTTNASYFPTFYAIAEGKKETRMVERLPLLPKLWGTLLIKSLNPNNARRLKAPGAFQPSSSDVADTIIQDFVTQQSQIAKQMEATRGMEVERIIITSPAASMITYSLMDAYRIVVVHEQRHYRQARRVTEDERFPQ